MQNAIDFSAFTELRLDLPFSNFSVKFVVEGCEHYTVNGYRHSVRAGHYLLANHFAEGFVEIESRNLVRGICINLASELLMEAVASHLRPGTPYPDLALDRYFSTPDYFENQYSITQTSAGQLLRGLQEANAKPVRHAPVSDPALLPPEVCFDLAERIVADHVPVFRQLQSIKTVKVATKKDLLRRVLRGKEYLDAHFSEQIDIASVARAACISEYHFFRLFKAVYGLSPYRYALRKRLEWAVSRIQAGHASLAEVAGESGFSDVHAFSKAFRKGMGMSPKAYLKVR